VAGPGIPTGDTVIFSLVEVISGPCPGLQKPLRQADLPAPACTPIPGNAPSMVSEWCQLVSDEPPQTTVLHVACIGAIPFIFGHAANPSRHCPGMGIRPLRLWKTRCPKTILRCASSSIYEISSIDRAYLFAALLIPIATNPKRAPQITLTTMPPMSPAVSSNGIDAVSPGLQVKNACKKTAIATPITA
jgi:hypothetical protein